MESVQNNGNETKQGSTLYLVVGILSLLSALWGCVWGLRDWPWRPVSIIASTALAVAAFAKIRKPAACIGCLFALIAVQCCEDLFFDIQSIFEYVEEYNAVQALLGVLGDVCCCLGYIALAGTLFAGLRKSVIGTGFLLVGVGYTFYFIDQIGLGFYFILAILNLLSEMLFISAMAAAAIIVFLLFSKNAETVEKAKKNMVPAGNFKYIFGNFK